MIKHVVKRIRRKLTKGYRRLSFKNLFKKAVFLQDPNLVQQLGMTPNRGLNYMVWRNCWPPNTHYQICKTNFVVLSSRLTIFA